MSAASVLSSLSTSLPSSLLAAAAALSSLSAGGVVVIGATYFVGVVDMGVFRCRCHLVTLAVLVVDTYCLLITFCSVVVVRADQSPLSRRRLFRAELFVSAATLLVVDLVAVVVDLVVIDLVAAACCSLRWVMPLPRSGALA